MKTIAAASAAVLSLFSIAGCTGGTPQETGARDQQVVVEGNNRFAFELYGRLRGQEGNLFFSPFSISTALAMAYAGARGGTETEMAEVLRFTLKQDRLHPALAALIDDLSAGTKRDSLQLSVANALWGQKGFGFLKGFRGLVQTHYGARLEKVDFAGATESARLTINRWAADRTEGKIRDLIQPGILDELTRLVLANAIYFKGDWAAPFKKEGTANDLFTLAAGAGGGKIEAPMMNRTGSFGYLEDEILQVLTLPYAGNRLVMVVLLPKRIDGLHALEDSLTAASLASWLERQRPRKVEVFLPRFKMTCGFSLADVLVSMGMAEPFTPGAADFSGMDGKRDLFISAVVHKAFVDVNEERTEAAAATVVYKELGVPLIPVFRADHPFLFLIQDVRTNSVLFIGRVMNPKV